MAVEPEVREGHIHKESLVSQDDKVIGTCECGQVIEYDPEGKKPPRIIKRGKPVESVKPSRQLEAPNKESLKPANWDALTRMQKFIWYEDHREQILHDFGTLGNTKTLKRWGISAATFNGLKKRWLGEDYIPYDRRGTLPAGLQLPQLPDFSDNWPESTQVKWLEVFEQLCKGDKHG